MIDLSALRKESDIIKTWKSSVPEVSVVCITFNQSAYIAQALESLVSQHTSFPFEVVVHDDASTDGTTSIVEKYADLYPNLIRPIYCEENQYRINQHLPFTRSLAASRGRYVAICEGDDYWTDNSKLQVQFDVMEANPRVMLSYHPVHMLMGSDLHKAEPASEHDYEFVQPSTIISGGGGACPTASSMYRRSVLEELPEWYMSTPVGDYYNQALAAARGGAIRISEPMAVYRCLSIGSFTAALASKPAEKRLEYAQAVVDSNESLAGSIDSRFRKDVIKCSLDYLLDLAFDFLGRKEVGHAFRTAVWANRISPLVMPRSLFDQIKIRFNRIRERLSN